MNRPFISSAMALCCVLSVGAFSTSLPVWADSSDTLSQGVQTEQTVTFNIEKMTCGLCPITVRKAMEGVAGVQSVSVDFAAKTATAVFDSTVTDTQEIGTASGDAGYPAEPAS